MKKPDSTRSLTKVKSELDALIRPTPNSKILGMRLGLFYHYRAQQKKLNFISKWINKKIGEEPVYLSEVNPERIKELINNRLENRGFFYNKLQAVIDSSDKKSEIQYIVELKTPYKLNNLTIEGDSLPIYKEIKELMSQTALKSGRRFDLEVMKFERERIDRELKQIGYYNFNPDFLIFEADTNRYRNKRFDLFLRLKKDTPTRAMVPYTIDSIIVYPNHNVDQTSKVNDTIVLDDISFIQDEEYFKPRLLEPYILFEKGQKYNANTSRLTSNRLSSIGSYKFVNIKFKELDSVLTGYDEGSLAADIKLSPLNKRSLRASVEAVTKSNDFAGPGISVVYSNRNLFKGGETLSLTGTFAYETQLSGGDQSGLTSIAGGLKADLILPRLVPFSPSRFKYAVPKTKVSMGVEYLNRSQLYSLNSFSTSYGYTWNANRFVYHQLNPISINYVNLSNTTAEFEAILDENSFLERSFDQQFIAGLTYNFTYNGLVDQQDTHSIYLSTGIDVAGNVLNLLSGGEQTFLNLEYAQYAKADVDLRYYFRFGKEQALVTRVFAGIGLPYGNSTTLPFVKQYFSGGPYSVRAFKIRSLGPGTYTSDEDSTTSFFDQSGDIKLEANIEYRFPIFSYLKGAVFADAGNVWLTGGKEIEGEDEDEENINEELITRGTFGSDWINELGIGAGVGLRVDIQSFVIRFDLATPLHIPYAEEGERWNSGFDFSSDNLKLNFAIGYPF
ncbi:BamA/TamA family outer membrane protein [Aquimarina addita]|uniref:BamA/TamA family outer membrane protein n=2 Tax=Aquimarina addita TaxID=870485 RepID=A0ABP7X916_9FLAO